MKEDNGRILNLCGFVGFTAERFVLNHCLAFSPV